MEYSIVSQHSVLASRLGRWDIVNCISAEPTRSLTGHNTEGIQVQATVTREF
jgi:enoyl-[acyl-carrier-protein] reductase (NADH)